MKKLLISAIVAAAACGICQASVKDLMVYDKANNLIATHNGVTALSISGGTLTVHTPAGDTPYEMNNLGEFAVPGMTGIGAAVAANEISASISGGIITVSAPEAIGKIELYTTAGALIAAIAPAAETVSLPLASDAAVIIARIHTASATTVVKLINR